MGHREFFDTRELLDYIHGKAAPKNGAFEELLEHTEKGRDSIRNPGTSGYFGDAVELLETRLNGRRYAECVLENPDETLATYRQLALAEQTDIETTAGQYAEDIEKAYLATANQLVEQLEGR